MNGDSIFRTKIILDAFVHVADADVAEEFCFALAVSLLMENLVYGILGHSDAVIRDIYFKGLFEAQVCALGRNSDFTGCLSRFYSMKQGIFNDGLEGKTVNFTIV